MKSGAVYMPNTARHTSAAATQPSHARQRGARDGVEADVADIEEPMCMVVRLPL